MERTLQNRNIGLAFVLLWILFIQSTSAQVNLSHKSDWFYIENGYDVFIRGNITSLDSNADPIINLGEMYITDTITCFGTNKIFGTTPDTIHGNVYLVGDKPQYFDGDKNIRFGNLFIQNSHDSLFLLNNVDIYNKMQLDYGNVYINDYKTLDFLSTGKLLGETNSKRVYGNNYGQMHLNRPLINGNTYTNIGGFGLDLTINGNLGVNTHIWRKNVQQVNVSNGSIDRFYSFSPENNGFVSSPNIHYLDTIELHNNNEDSIKLYLSQTNGNTWVEKGGTNDTINDKVSTDASLSFVLSNQSMLTLAEVKCDNPPYLHFAEDTIPLCNNAPAWLFADGTIGMSSVWNNGIINSDSIQVSTAGTYAVTVTDIYGCPSTDSVVVISAPNPVADFSVPPVCVGSLTDFTNLTTISSGAVSYVWDLNDIYSSNEDTSTLINPSITYTNQGSYSASLIATSNYGCTDKKTKLAVVNPYPLINITLQNNCADSILSISNTTVVLPNNTITYNWNFGDGDSSTAKVPSHSFSTAGSYLVELQATSQSCTSTETQNITISPNPIASFIANPVCLTQSTVFTNTTSISSGTTSYSWNFENGNSSILSNPTYSFGSAGTYPVKLTATSNTGCIHDTTISVIVNSLPSPTFSVSPTCQEDTMLFTNTSSSSSSFVWDFNSEGQSTDFSPGYSFNTSGNKSIVLTETDINGCVNSITTNITSKPKPFTDFIPSDGCEQENITFLNSTSTPSGSITYLWDFDDANTSSIQSPSHAFSTANVYNVKLVAENNGCFDSISKSITIHPKPVLNFGGSIATCADSLILDAQNPGYTYLWSDQSTNQYFSVNYSGTYWVDIISPFSCTESDTVNVTLSSVVSPNLGLDSTFCDNALLSAGYNGSTYLWSTGATTQTINVNSSDTVWVKVTDQNNCTGYDTIVAEIVNSTLPNLGSDLLKCNGEITNLSTGHSGMSYLWSNGSTTDTLSVSQSGLYWVRLTDTNYCASYDSILVTYNTNPILNLGLDTNYCDSTAFDISQTNSTYLWDNGSTSGQRIITNTGQYWAIIHDSLTGCTSIDTVNILMSPTPIVDLGNDTTLCNGDHILLNTNYPQFDALWNIGDTTSTVLATATGYYSVNVSTSLGCVGNDSIYITVSNPLDPYLGPDFVLCKNNVADINSPIDSANYSWIFNDTLLSETTQSISLSWPGELISSVTTTAGCNAIDTIVLLETSSEINAAFIVATNGVYDGDTIQFINFSSPNNYTCTWDFGDGAFSIQENPTHVFSTEGIYKVILESSNGICTDTTSKKITVLSSVKKRESDFAESNRIVNYKLYPNPNKGQFKLDIKLLEQSEVNISCFDICGRLIQSDNVNDKEFAINYSMSELATGMYIIKISIAEQVKYLKFIKQ